VAKDIFKVEKSEKLRIDKFLAGKYSDFSRTFVQKLIDEGNVTVNNSIPTQKYILKFGDVISVEVPKKEEQTFLEPENFNFKILYEDEDVLVIDKPAGVVVHPAPGSHSGTVVNALLGRDNDFMEKFCSDENTALMRPGIVHRLDKDTSGCLIIAKNMLSLNNLSKAFAEHKIKKEYKALIYTIPQDIKGKIETLIGRHPVNRKKMAVVTRNGKEAITYYHLERSGTINNIDVSLLSVNIVTGRTHQIRVHLSYKKMPIIGDIIYGGKQRISAPRQLLHAAKIEFPHPISGLTITATSEYPTDFQKYLSLMK